MTTDTTAPTAADSSNEAAPEAPRQGPGRLIRLARERARLGVTELAALTKLAPATLEALERDDFTTLNEPVYVRGYYRKCAKALAIGEQDLLAAYEKLVAPRAPQVPTKLLLGSGEGSTSLRKSRRAGPRWPLWLVGFGALVGVAAWFLREDANGRRLAAALPETPAALPKPALVAPPPSPSSSTAAPAPSSAQAAPPAAAPEATRPLSTNELSTTPAERSLAQSPAAEPPPAAATAPAAAAPATGQAASGNADSGAAAAAAPAGPQALSLNFKSTSWVRIEDSNGKVLLSGVIQGGDHQVIAGKPPYSLFLGNAPGVDVEFHGQPVDLKPYIKSNDTARLSVPAAAGQ